MTGRYQSCPSCVGSPWEEPCYACGRGRRQTCAHEWAGGGKYLWCVECREPHPDNPSGRRQTSDEEQWGVRWADGRVWQYVSKIEAERGIERQATVGWEGNLVHRTVTVTAWADAEVPDDASRPTLGPMDVENTTNPRLSVGHNLSWPDDASSQTAATGPSVTTDQAEETP